MDRKKLRAVTAATGTTSLSAKRVMFDQQRTQQLRIIDCCCTVSTFFYLYHLHRYTCTIYSGIYAGL